MLSIKKKTLKSKYPIYVTLLNTTFKNIYIAAMRNCHIDTEYVYILKKYFINTNL